MRKNPRIGSYEYYERLYNVEERHWWCKGIREVAAGILNAHYQGAKGLNVLDAGCGAGMTLALLERYSLPKRVVVGIDLSWYALEFSRRRGQFLLAQSSILELPFKNGSFDLVVCNDVIQHLRSGADKAALREFYRVLKPGGCLLLRTNSSQGIGKEIKQGDENYKMYNLKEARDKVRETGFHILKLTCANMLMSIAPTIRRYLKHRKDRVYHSLGLPHKLLPRHLQWLNPLLYCVMKSEAWFLSKPSLTSSFGHTIMVLSQKPKSDHQI